MRKFLAALPLSWVLPFLLALFPLFIFWRGAVWERQQLSRTQEDRWLRSVERGSRWLQKGGEASYWAELTARRFQTMAQRKLATLSGSRDQPTRDDIQQAVLEAVRRMHPAGMPQCQIWVLPLTGAKPGKLPALLEGPGLSQKPKRVMTTILDGIAEESRGNPSPVFQKDFQNRLEHTFGFGVSEDLFTDPFRGIGIPTIFGRQYGHLVWNTILFRNRPTAIFILISPLTDIQPQKLARLCLLHFSRILPQTRLIPAFLPMQSWDDAKPARLYVPSHQRQSPALLLARSLQKEIRLQRGERVRPTMVPDLLQVKSFQLPKYHFGERAKGRAHLPVARLNQVTRDKTGHWWGSLITVAPRLGAFGLLVGEPPPNACGWLEFSALLWTSILLLLLALLTGEHFWFGRSITLGARTSLLAWFFGLAMIPLALSLENGGRYLSDLRESLQEDLRQQLVRAIQSVEAGNSQNTQKLEAACIRFFQSHTAWDPKLFAQTATETKDPIRSYLNQAFFQSGTEVDGVFIHSSHGFEYAHIHPSIQAASKRLFSTALKNLIKTKINLEKKLGRVPDSTEILANDPWLGNLSGKVENSMFRTDYLNNIGLGEKQVFSFYQETVPPEKTKFGFLLLFRQETLMDAHLAAFMEHWETRSSFDLGVFKESGARWESLVEGGNTQGLEKIAALSGLTKALVTPGSIIVRQPSRYLSKYVFVGRASTASIQQHLNQEIRNMAVTWILLLFLVGAGGLALSQWLAAPIILMSRALEQVSRGDFSLRLGIERGDELGRTASTLDAMIQKLDERHRMSHFVNRTVLETISQDSNQSPGKAQRDSFVALVSDIRSFTTLSETYSPQRIFTLLNRHLERVSRVIQRHGGIVERFIGDAVQAVFPISELSPHHGTERALLAAVEIMMEHHDLQRERVASGDFGYRIGVGLELGPMVRGVVGDPETRLDLSFLGEALPRAAALESASRYGHHSHIVCSEAFRKKLPSDWQFSPLSDVDDAWELISMSTEQPSTGTDSSSFLRPTPPSPPTPKTVEPNPLPEKQSSPLLQPSPTFFSPMRVVVFCLLVLLVTLSPAILLYQKEIELGQEVTMSQTSEVRRLLQLDQRILSRKHLNSDSFADMIGLELDGATAKIPPGAQRGLALAEEVQNRLNAIQKQFPAFHWLWVTRSNQALDYSQLGHKTFQVTRWSGVIPHMNTDEACMLVAGAVHRFFFNEVPFIQELPWHTLCKERLPGLDIDSSLGRWFPGRADRHEKICWFPLFAHEWWNDPERFLPFRTTGHFADDGLRPVHQAFLGTVICFWDAPEIAPEANRHGLFRIVEHFGGKLLAWDPHQPGRFQGNLQPQAEPWVVEAMKGADKKEIFENHLVQHVSLADSPQTKILLARPLPAPPQSPGRGYFPYVLGFCLIFSLFILNTVLTRGRKILSLPLQMVLAFLFVLLPSLAVGLFSAERSFVARSTRLLPKLTQDGRDQISLFHRGFSAWTAFGTAVLDSTFRCRKSQEALSHLPADAAERQARSLNFVAETTWEILHRGWFTRSPTFYNFAMDETYYVKGHIRRAELSLEDQYSRLLARRTLSVMNPSLTQRGTESDARKEVLDGAKMEEITTISRAVTPPEIIPQASNHPFCSIPGTSRNEIYWVRHLLVNGAPLFMTRSDWRVEVMLSQHLNTWFSEHPIDSLIVSQVGEPKKQFHPPFMMFDLDTTYPDPGFTQVFTPMEPSLALNTTLANTSDELFVSLTGSGTSETLQVTEPTQDKVGVLVSCLLPFGQERAKLWQAHLIDRILFLAALLFAIFLAVQAARRYTAPLLELSEKARGIQEGDYSVRMPAGQDDEFGQLARNFNAMAQGVHEGRLLSRFVSESVREAAQNRDLEQEAEKGTGEEAVVVFTGLSGFSRLLGELPPEILIDHLNRYLGVMARLIREEGGRIDKFIGDKILAVFRPRDFGSAAQAMEKATRAVRHMQQNMSLFRSTLPCNLGAGLVFGPVLSGIMGTSEVRREFTVIGDTVNLASRLSDLGMKQPGGGIVIETAGRAQLQKAPDSSWGTLEPLDVNTVKGKTRQVEVFLLTDPDKS